MATPSGRVHLLENWMEKPDLLMKKSLSNCSVSELKVLWMSSGSAEPLHSFRRMLLSSGPSYTLRMSCASSVSNTMKWRLQERAQLSTGSLPSLPSTTPQRLQEPTAPSRPSSGAEGTEGTHVCISTQHELLSCRAAEKLGYGRRHPLGLQPFHWDWVFL